MPTVVTALHDYLIAQGIGRNPDTLGTLPPIWRDGDSTGLLPAPGEGNNPTQVGQDAVIGLFRTTGIPVARFEGERRRPIIQVNLRVRRAPIAETLGEQIEAAVLDKRNWPMGGLRVIESQQVGPLSFTGRSEDGKTRDYRMSFAFELYRDPAVLAVP
jgi:hypothetical protein